MGSNMAAACGPASLVCLCVVLLSAVTGLQSEDTVCAFADQLEGRDSHSGLANELRGAVGENGTISCGRGSRCYGLWEKRPDGEIHLVNQGCWTHIGHQQECHGDRCLVTAPPSQIQNGSYRFCCCSRNLCNINFTEAPPTANTPALGVMKTESRGNGQTAQRLLQREATALIALVTVAIAAAVIITLFLCYRMMRGKKKEAGLSALAVMEAANTDAAVDPEDLKLLELIGRGRYGTVFRSRLNERCVAVKVFSSANRQNFLNERTIYCLPLLQQHDNIARFLTADERMTADGRPEFLLLMEFYPHGCLSHYLSLHTVDWSTCCRMTQGVTRGLAFLHTELSRGDQYKPAVAHRDVTSRNVLVRADLSCVLADFGLSMRLTTSRPCCPGDDDTMAISEVGTVRYMAPEVLGGALNLRDCESALKQVDVYALGLLYWESFRRCSHLFPGEAVPEYQPAFQEELGNHPSFEQMQILVVREKFRPRFPEAWKVNSLALRSLKETMEDCWDQDAEARLTAQCAEERLSELALLTTHTAIHNHRNLSHGCSSPQVGSTSSYIEDQQVGVVKNLQGDVHPASVVRTTTSGTEGAEKNRNSINYKRQLAKARSSSSDSSMSAITAQTSGSVLCSISESLSMKHSEYDLDPDQTQNRSHIGDAGPTIPVRLQLTEEDLEATKLDPEEVQKNTRESSDENLMELSQKTFGATEQQPTNLLYRQTPRPAEVSPAAPGPGAPPVSCSIHPLPKQQNLPQRPTSLHLLPKPKDTASASRFKLGKLKSNHKQVETGVAKMNTVTVGTAVEPHPVATVSNNTSVRSQVHAVNLLSNRCSSGVPTLVKNGALGRTNPAGPQLEEEDKIESGATGGEDPCLNFSPDEHEPLLRREQPPAQSPPVPHQHPHHQPGPGNVPSGKGPNSNNNNNRVAVGSEVEIRGLKVGPEVRIGSEVVWGGESRTKGEPHFVSQLPGPAGGAASSNAQTLQARPTGQDGSQGSYRGPEPALTPQSTAPPTAHVADPTALGSGCSDPDSGSAFSSPSQVSQAQETAPVPETPVPEAPVPEAPVPEAPGPEAPVTEAPVPEAPVPGAPVPETPVLEAPGPEAPVPEAPVPGAPVPEAPGPEAPVPEAPVPEAPVPEAPGPEAPVTEAPVPEAPVPETPVPEAPGPEAPVPEAPGPEAPVPEAPVPETPVPEAPVPEAPVPETPVPEAPIENQRVSFSGAASETPALKTQALESGTTASARDPSALQSPALEPLTPGLLRSQMGPPKAKRPERPSSLDLSSSCMYSDDASLTESLSASGEKIKRRVKTPYTLKKWRPASWVVSTDTALDLDLEFTSSSDSQTRSSSSAQRAGGFGIPHINQSKSSMAVFLVGGGATATTTSEPDGTTSF